MIVTQTKAKKLDNIFIVIVLSIIPFLYTNKTFDPNLIIQLTAVSAVLILFYIAKVFSNIKLIINKKALFFFTAFLTYVLYSVVSVGISFNKPDAYFSISKYILYFVLALTFFSLKIDSIKGISFAITILSIVVSVPALFQFVKSVERVDSFTIFSFYKIKSVLGHRNLLSQTLLLSLPFVSYLYLTSQKTIKYISIIAFNIIMFLMIVLSNRTTWIGIIMLAMFWTVILIIYRKKIISNRSRLVLFFINSIVILLVSLYLMQSITKSGVIESHAIESVNITKGSTKDRLGLWSRTLTLIGENPLLGGGLDTWKINILKYGNEGLVSEDNVTFYQRPHNDFLWIASEQGLVGVFLYTLLWLIMIILLIKQIRQLDNLNKKVELFVVFSLTIVYLLISLLSFPKERIGHNILLYAAWGVALSGMYSQNKDGFKKELNIKLLSVVILPILIGVFVIGKNRYKSEVHAKKAIVLKKASKFQASLAELNNAKSSFYTMDAMSTPLSWYEGMAYYNLRQYEKANKAYKKALIINPYHIYVLDDYASSLVKLKKTKEAIQKYEQALEISPSFLNPKLNLCAIYYKSNQYEEALKLLKTIDENEASVRYKKTNRVILSKIIEKHTKFTAQDISLLREGVKSDSLFFKKLISNIIINNLKPGEVAHEALALVKKTKE